jgi:RNA polymerase sigma-70 factor (ECF subfamily)
MGITGPSDADALPFPTLSDSEIVRRVRAGDLASFEVLIRRHNQRIYRAARAILRDQTEVEDVMQQTYVNAFTHLHQFEERSRFSTWLTRIAVNEAIGRRQRMHQGTHATGDEVAAAISPQPTPEHLAYAGELQRLLEEAVDGLPDAYRAVFMLRDIEGLSTSETGDALELGDEAVKTRLHRARAMLRSVVASRIGGAANSAFRFHAPRCDRVVAVVLSRISGV